MNTKFSFGKRLADIAFRYHPHELPWLIANADREIIVQRDKVLSLQSVREGYSDLNQNDSIVGKNEAVHACEAFRRWAVVVMLRFGLVQLSA